MKYPLAYSAEYKPKQVNKVCNYNPNVFKLSELDDELCLRLINRMRKNAPGLYHLIHNDPLIKMLITNFNADIHIAKRTPQNRAIQR